MLPVFSTATETIDRPATTDVRRAADREAGARGPGHGDDDRDGLPDDLGQADGATAGDRLVVLEDQARDVLAGRRRGGNGDVERAPDRLARPEGGDRVAVVEPGGHARPG